MPVPFSAPTDRHAATVTELPVSPKDVLATACHLPGIDPPTLLDDRTARLTR